MQSVNQEISQPLEIDPLSTGILLGVLIGEGHFGGDGKQPQITLRMHVRHEKLFRWLVQLIPGSKLYGPYDHGGREYFQWMVRGEPLKKNLVPLLRRSLLEFLDPYTSERLQKMLKDYHL